MKKLSLLFMMLAVTVTALAGTKTGAPSRIDPADVWGDDHHVYQRLNHGSAVTPEHTYMTPQDGFLEVVTGDGGNFVYVKTPVYGSEKEFGEYWIEGTSDQQGGFYLYLGEPFYFQNRDGSFVKSKRNAVLSWGSLHYDAATNQTTFVRNADVSTVHYTVDGTTIIIEDTSGPVAIEAQDDVSYDAEGLAIVWEEAEGETGQEGEWSGYLEWGTILEAGTPCVIDWQPEGELKTYQRNSDCISFSDYEYSYRSANAFSAEALTDEGQIVFGDDGKSVYLKDPLLSMKHNTWVMGTLNDDGTIITVNLPQCIYTYESGTALSVVPCLCNIKTITPNNEAPYDVLSVNSDYSFTRMTYLIDGNKITLQNTNADLGAGYPDNFTAYGLHVYDPVTDEGCIEANIVYTLKTDNPDPIETTSVPVFDGEAGADGSYWVEILPTEPSTIYYRVQYSTREYSNWDEYSATLNFTGEGDYKIEAYAKAENKLPSAHVYHEFTISPSTSIIETMVGKDIVGKRYFNVMGQEIQQPEGVTIEVTTYSDGTSTAVKVVK